MPRFIRLWAIVTGFLFVEVLGPSACVVDGASNSLPTPGMSRDPNRIGAGGSDPMGATGDAPDETTGAADAGTSGSGGAGPADDGSLAQGGAHNGGGGGSEEGEGGSNQSTLCFRLPSPIALSFDVTRAYEQGVFADCRVSWVTRLYLDLDERAEFFNRLLAWNLNFWGCSPPAPTDFALIYLPVMLTTKDAQALVDHYIAAANDALRMSASEREQMRGALAQLADPLVDATANDFSHSACPRDAGADIEGIFDASDATDAVDATDATDASDATDATNAVESGREAMVDEDAG
jgi:hypothetical protein